MSSTNVLGLAACYRGKHDQYVTPPNHVQSNSDTHNEYRSLLKSLKDMHQDKITPETQQIILNYSDDDDSDAEDNENTLQDKTNVESFENSVQNGLKPPEALDSRLISMFWFCFIVGCLLLYLQ